jgi:hypothetical protein
MRYCHGFLKTTHTQRIPEADFERALLERELEAKKEVEREREAEAPVGQEAG